MFLKRLPVFLCFGACLFATVAEAVNRRIDFSKRSTAQNQSFTRKSNNLTQQQSTLGGKKVEFSKWHKQFSKLGSKRSSVALKDGGVDKDLKTFSRVSKKTAPLATGATPRKEAHISNWNHVREMILVSKYSQNTITSPVGRRFQMELDELSLRDLNRFQTQRNKTDDGIPTQRAGGAQESFELPDPIEFKDQVEAAVPVTTVGEE